MGHISLSTITVHTCNLKLSMNKEVKEYLYFTYATYFFKTVNGIIDICPPIKSLKCIECPIYFLWRSMQCIYLRDQQHFLKSLTTVDSFVIIHEIVYVHPSFRFILGFWGLVRGFSSHSRFFTYNESYPLQVNGCKCRPMLGSHGH